MDTNFFGPFNLIQAVTPSMRDRKSGTIVNISSAAGFDPRPAMSMYGASKSALEGMSQGLAKKLHHLASESSLYNPELLPQTF
jgi:short-subunit dehydrogenase